MLNHITIMGRLTADPELRYTQSGVAVASFRVAVDRDYQPRDGGERQTDFINVAAWRQTGEFVSKYFTKGSMIVVSGRLQMRDWTDKEGGRRTTAEVVADNIYFGESRRSREENSGSYRSAEPRQGGYQQSGGYVQDNYSGFNSAPSGGSAFEELDDGDGELPF